MSGNSKNQEWGPPQDNSMETTDRKFLQENGSRNNPQSAIGVTDQNLMETNQTNEIARVNGSNQVVPSSDNPRGHILEINDQIQNDNIADAEQIRGREDQSIESYAKPEYLANYQPSEAATNQMNQDVGFISARKPEKQQTITIQEEIDNSPINRQQNNTQQMIQKDGKELFYPSHDSSDLSRKKQKNKKIIDDGESQLESTYMQAPKAPTQVSGQNTSGRDLSTRQEKSFRQSRSRSGFKQSASGQRGSGPAAGGNVQSKTHVRYSQIQSQNQFDQQFQKQKGNKIMEAPTKNQETKTPGDHAPRRRKAIKKNENFTQESLTIDRKLDTLPAKKNKGAMTLAQTVMNEMKELKAVKARMNLFTYNNGELIFYEPRNCRAMSVQSFLSLYLKYVVMACIGLFLLTEVLYKSIMQLDTIKMQSQQVIKHDNYTYNLTGEVVPIHFFTLLNKSETLERYDCGLRKDNATNMKCQYFECAKKPLKTERMACGAGLKTADGKQYNAEEDVSFVLSKKYYDPKTEIQKYICDNMYAKFETYDSMTEVDFQLDCEVLDHGDGTLKAHYKFGKKPVPYYRSDDIGVNDTLANRIVFNKTYENSQGFVKGFKDELRGIRSVQIASYHNLADDPKAAQFEQLNKTRNYRDFWASPHNQVLFSFDDEEGVDRLGDSVVEQIILEAQPEIKMYKKRLVKSRFMGVPTAYGDRVDDFLKLKEKYQKTKRLKDDVYDPNYGNLAFAARIDFDFHQDTHVYEYFGMADLVSKLGGIGASLKIMLGSFTIFFCFQYIMGLSQAFRRRYQYKYQKQETIKMYAFFEEIANRDPAQKKDFDISTMIAIDKIIMQKPRIQMNDYLQTDELYNMMLRVKAEVAQQEKQPDYSMHPIEEMTNEGSELATLKSSIQHQEPELDKLERLTYERSKFSVYDVIRKIKQRVSFFGIYRLYDKFEQNRCEQQQISDILNQKIELNKNKAEFEMSKLAQSLHDKLETSNAQSLKLMDHITSLVEKIEHQSSQIENQQQLIDNQRKQMTKMNKTIKNLMNMQAANQAMMYGEDNTAQFE